MMHYVVKSPETFPPPTNHPNFVGFMERQYVEELDLSRETDYGRDPELPEAL